MMRFLPIVVGVILLGICTYFQGAWTERWSNSTADELEILVQRYAQIPKRIGDVWVGEDTAGNSQRVLDRAGARASVSRLYRNSKTKETVSIFLVCGHARDIAVHTPDACYVGSGFVMERKPASYKIQSRNASSRLLTSTFRKERGGEVLHQRILWSWTNGGPWMAPDSPRYEFGGAAIINKIYLISNIQGDERRDLDDDPAVAFGRVFLPEAVKVLYPPEASADPVEVNPE